MYVGGAVGEPPSWDSTYCVVTALKAVGQQLAMQRLLPGLPDTLSSVYFTLGFLWLPVLGVASG